MLAVKPDCQGTGRGTALLERGLKSLDGYHYLETHKEGNLQFYRKHGFEMRFETEISESQLHVWVMERSLGL